MASRVISRVSLTHCVRSQRQSLSSRLSSNVRLMSSISSTRRVDLLKSAVDSTGSLTRTGSHVIKRSCSTSQPEVHSRIESLVTGKPLVVFMKGTPEQPLCGFSNAVCQILRMHGVGPFDSYNILEDEELRQGIKEYSNWPTIPQVYIGGEFVGGCDIMIDMHKNGELIEELKKVGIKSDLDD